MKIIVDRVEGAFAVCEKEDRTMMEIAVSEFEEMPRDGDVVWYENHCARILKEETENRKREAEELFRKLLKKERL